MLTKSGHVSFVENGTLIEVTCKSHILLFNFLTKLGVKSAEIYTVNFYDISRGEAVQMQGIIIPNEI